MLRLERPSPELLRKRELTRLLHVSSRAIVRWRRVNRRFLGVGELSADQFTAFLVDSLAVLQRSATDAALLYACMDWRHLYELLAAGRQCGLELFNICVWAKTNAGMGSLYRSQHELVCVFKAGNADHTNNIELGRHGRNRSNLWTYRGLNSFGADRNELLASHPTVKPVLMIADAIRDVTKCNGHALISALKSKHHRLVHEIIPEGSKTARLRRHIESILGQRIILPKDARWRAEFVSEFVQFPYSDFTDQVDATTQYLDWISGQPKLEPLPQPALNACVNSAGQHVIGMRADPRLSNAKCGRGDVAVLFTGTRR